MLRVDQVLVIRHKVLQEGRSVRSVAREFGVSRNTVQKYLSQAEPVRQEYPQRSHPVRDVIQGQIDVWMSDKRLTSEKHRWTAPRMQELLAAKGLFASERTVRRCMADYRRRHAEVFIPLTYGLGELMEVDFFEVLIGPPDARRKAWMFVMHEMCSGSDFACLYDRQDQISFLDGHVRAFEYFGGVPQRIAYDNLRAAVKRSLIGSDRVLTDRFAAMVSHYLFEPCFARPATGHDKGGVEARGKGIRWRHLTPIPEGTDLDDISSALQVRLDAQAIARGVTLETLQTALAALPDRPFKAESIRFVSANASSRIRLDGARYSVPETWARTQVEVHVGARDITFVRGAARLIQPRLRSGESSVQYLHYLHALSCKPQALRQVAPSLVAELGKPFDALWSLLSDRYGGKDAARRFKDVLKAIQASGLEQVRLRLALCIDEPDPLQILLGTTDAGLPPKSWFVPQPLQIDVPAPSLAAYDALLGGAV